MLDAETRSAIFRLRDGGHSIRATARILSVSRNAVRGVLRSGIAEVPSIERASMLDTEIDTIRDFIHRCKGNLVRVHEELAARGVDVAYATLTKFCRQNNLGGGRPKPERAGRYVFEPGEEFQHDTSPHTVVIGGKKQRIECASLVLCYSRMIFAQACLRWNRFQAKIFLTDGICYFGGSARRAMIDNTSVIVAHGSGANAVMAPEMEAFSRRFGFKFRAHALGDANRSARVERPFGYIENNFYPGRTFEDIDDLNQQMRAWCDRVNKKTKRTIRARPIELFASEQRALVPLPPYIPEVYQVHHRTVDVEGNVNLHTNRYSVPDEVIGRQVEVRETKDEVKVFLGHRLLSKHRRVENRRGARSVLPEHRKKRRQGRKEKKEAMLREERDLRAAGEVFCQMVDALRKHCAGSGRRQIRRLHTFYVDYPTAPLRGALADALRYGLLDFNRIEKMVLKRVADEYFRLDELTHPPTQALLDEDNYDG